MKKRNKCIDSFKTAACALIVFLHYPFPGLYGEIVKAEARSAVPFFFIVSGYFYSKAYQEKGMLFCKKNVLNSIKLFTIGMLFSLIFLFMRENSINYLFQMFEASNIYKFLLFNDTGVIYHLWYLAALIYCYIGFSIVINRIDVLDIELLRRICMILIVLRFVLEAYLRATDGTQVYYFRNWLFTGIPFFGLGFILSNAEVNKLLLKVHCIPIMALGMMLSIVEYLLLGNREMYVGSVIMVIGIFIFALNNPDIHLSKSFNKFGRVYSGWVYLLHWGVMHVEYKIINILKLQSLGGGIYLWISPIMLFIYTAVSAVIAQKLVDFLWGIERRNEI